MEPRQEGVQKVPLARPPGRAILDPSGDPLLGRGGQGARGWECRSALGPPPKGVPQGVQKGVPDPLGPPGARIPGIPGLTAQDMPNRGSFWTPWGTPFGGGTWPLLHSQPLAPWPPPLRRGSPKGVQIQPRQSAQTPGTSKRGVWGEFMA